MKHVPQRTCIGCQVVRPKRELVRIVRTPAGEVVVDPTGRRPGRGAYICPDPHCLERALGGKRLERALEHPVAPETALALEQDLYDLIAARQTGEPAGR